MARFRGNIFTKAGGSIGSITFSRARDRQGKVQTARERVAPLNPQTPAQTAVRNKMVSSQWIVRNSGPGIYRIPWDRGISKLPGYQSLLSVLLRSTEVVSGNYNITAGVPETQLGGLHFPSTVNNPFYDGFACGFNFSTESGNNGSADDILKWIAVQGSVSEVDIQNRMMVTSDFQFEVTRGDGALDTDLSGSGIGTAGVNTWAAVLWWFEPGPTNDFTQPSPARLTIINP